MAKAHIYTYTHTYIHASEAYTETKQNKLNKANKS